KDYFHKSGFSKAILGLSGGIDSAVVAALATKALGPENVMAVLMPSEYSTEHSIQDALDLVENLDCEYEMIPIHEIVDTFDAALKPVFKDLPFNIAEENIQARSRAMIVMAMSNKFGYILLNTSNKSECAVGYGTLYGDMAGALSVLGDVYKTQVYKLAKYINRDEEVIPLNSIIKPASAELRPDQKDTDSLPEYDVLDAILYQYIEQKKGTAAIIAQGFDEALVRRVLKMVNNAEFKRKQAAPILRVSPKAFGMGRRMPIVGKYLG
ncbi:MAG TPA: NAD(+) synthase, partial [Daejeonella sp.]|nr:NAD(+) synthase [Daejeonella sp.]